MFYICYIFIYNIVYKILIRKILFTLLKIILELKTKPTTLVLHDDFSPKCKFALYSRVEFLHQFTGWSLYAATAKCLPFVRMNFAGVNVV